MDIMVEVVICGNSIPERAASAVLESVYTGIGDEVCAERTKLEHYPLGHTEHSSTSKLFDHNYIVVNFTIDRTVPPEIIATVVGDGLDRVKTRIGNEIGMAIVETLVTHTTGLFDPSGTSTVSRGLRSLLSTVRQTLLP